MAIRTSGFADATDAHRAEAGGEEVFSSMIATFVDTLGVVTVMVFVISVVAFVVYALMRPFTHVHYRHPSQKLWSPLD